MAFSRLLKVNVTVASRLTTVTQNFATYTTSDGTVVTANFNQDTEVGYDINGLPIIEKNSGLEITSITPASEQRVGVQTAWVNGAMANPYADYSGGVVLSQGWDESIGLARGPGSSGQVTYSGALNVDPGATASNYVVPLSGDTVLVKAIRRDATSNSIDATMDEFVPFAFVETLPQANAFAPEMTGINHGYTTDDIDYSVLPGLAYPSGQPTYAQAIAADVIGMPFFPGWGDEKRRRYEVQANITGGSSTGYSADNVHIRSVLMYLLCSNALSTTEREELAKRVVWHGLCVDGAAQRGYTFGTGAGQWHAYHAFHFFAAFLLKDAAMLNRARAVRSNMYNSPLWIDAGDEGRVVEFPAPAGGQNRYERTFMDHDIGKPFIVDKTRGAQAGASYLTISTVRGVCELFPCLVLQNGPSGETGEAALVNGAYDTTNDNAAILATYDRVKTFRRLERQFSAAVNGGTLDTENFIAAWSSGIANWGYTGFPDEIDSYQTGDIQITTAGNGAFSWNFGSLNFSGNQPIIDRRVRYSLDERSWIEHGGNGAMGSVSGLMRGAKYYVQYAMENASGVGPFSPNYPVAVGDAERNVITTAGAEANAAPLNLVAPELVYRKYPNWGGPSWQPADVVLTISQALYLSCGVGGWSGSPALNYDAGDFSFQWQESVDGATGWTDITVAAGYDRDATDQDFVPRSENADRFIRCGVTATNTQGSTTAYSNATQVPSVTPGPGAGVIIDTDFSGDFAFTYEPELDALMFGSHGAASGYYPDFTIETGSVTGDTANAAVLPGGILVDKLANFPFVRILFARPLTAGATYRIELQVITTASFSGTMRVWLERQSNNSDYAAYEERDDVSGTVSVINFDYQVVIGAGEADLNAQILILQQNNGANASGGDFYVTRLRVSEV